ncbi:lipoyl(octanoyl) transferase LipB [Paenibacillus provencensis]|uniref:Octanoyltransferase n=1 Tax=Paenibacillus provencensis TaxID=441151 RepID=A0ABW3PQ53_9BACL|nr:lipoyl(octanoyl) transferase LipB [Paenibacillus sp. MER 78]MCM3126485.1 lipoyl(octanoyl) transferase LipB [Paenibacillus sp. MER 78]
MSRPLVVNYTELMDYEEAWNLQKKLVNALDEEEQQEHLLLLQHPPTYTMGTQRHPEHLLYSSEELANRGIALFQIDRGGDITYHGPGQLVGYPILRLGREEDVDLHGYLRLLEEVIIQYLDRYGIAAGRKEQYTGVWVDNHKICAIGVKFNRSRRTRGFITSHGFAFNIKSGIQNEGFSGIIPCGIEEYGVTSLEDCTGQTFSVKKVADELVTIFASLFSFKPTWVQVMASK